MSSKTLANIHNFEAMSDSDKLTYVMLEIGFSAPYPYELSVVDNFIEENLEEIEAYGIYVYEVDPHAVLADLIVIG